MENPFKPAPKGETTVSPETLQKWRIMQGHLNDKTDLSRLQPTVARILGEKIENQWQSWARTSGQVFPEQFRDPFGRECTRYEGDIKSAFAPWIQEPAKVKLATLTHFEGKSYVRGQEPPAVRRAMALIRAGFSE